MTSRQKRLQSDIGEVLATTPKGTEWGVAVIDAQRFKLIAGVNAGARFEALSLSKVALAHVAARQIARGAKQWNEPLRIKLADVRAGGFLDRTQNQLIPTVQEVLQTTLHVSETTGQRALTRIFGGPEAVNGLIHMLPPQSSSGMPYPLIVTRLRPVAGETGPEARFYTDDTTPFEAAVTVAAATDEPIVATAMQQNIFTYGVRRDLPGTVTPDANYLALLQRAAAPAQEVTRQELLHLMHPNWKLSSYAGMMGIDGEDGMWHDTVRIGDTVLASFSEGHPSLAENQNHPALDVHAQLGRLVFDYAQAA